MKKKLNQIMGVLYSGCSRDGHIAAMDIHGCGKYGLEIQGEKAPLEPPVEKIIT